MRMNPLRRVTALDRVRWWHGLLGFAVISVAAWLLLWPEIHRARINRNESAVIAALKQISSAQSQLQASGLCDADGNGQGEYGFFGQLAGKDPMRSPPGVPPRLCDPPVLPPAFADVVDGRVRIGGYWLEMFLPSDEGVWVSEAAAEGRVSVSSSEVFWTCYAYPVEFGVTGRRAFMINQSGDVISTNQAARPRKYSGNHRPMPGQAGFARSAGAVPIQQALVAANSQDYVGDTWVVI